jgi:hypothetical protein
VQVRCNCASREEEEHEGNESECQPPAWRVDTRADECSKHAQRLFMS